MLERLSDKHIEVLLKAAKKRNGLRPFFGPPKGMICLRSEAARRGIYATKGEADRVMSSVFTKLEENSKSGEIK